MKERLNQVANELQEKSEAHLVIKKKQRELQQWQEKIQHFDKLILEGRPPLSSNDFGILEKHNLITNWPINQSLQVTILQGGEKICKDHPPHESQEEVQDSYRWIVGIKGAYSNITYSFKRCPWSKGCLILQIQKKNDNLLTINSEKKNVIELTNLSKRQNGDPVLELVCELRLSENCFFIYNGKTLYKSIYY